MCVYMHVYDAIYVNHYCILPVCFICVVYACSVCIFDTYVYHLSSMYIIQLSYVYLTIYTILYYRYEGGHQAFRLRLLPLGRVAVEGCGGHIQQASCSYRPAAYEVLLIVVVCVLFTFLVCYDRVCMYTLVYVCISCM